MGVCVCVREREREREFVCVLTLIMEKNKRFSTSHFYHSIFFFLLFLLSQHVPLFKPYVMSAAPDNVNVDIIKSKNSNVAR